VTKQGERWERARTNEAYDHVGFLGQWPLREVERLNNGNTIVCVTTKHAVGPPMPAFYYYEVETAPGIPLLSLLDQIEEGYPAVRMESYDD